MGADKQLLVVGGKPMLLGVLDALLASRVDGVVVVTRSEIACHIPPRPRLTIAQNNVADSEMIDSVRIGLAAWRDAGAAAETGGFLVCPGDHPGIAPADFDACMDAFRARPTQIVLAARAGRRGHPILFPASDVPFVESSACDAGLHALPRAFSARVRLVDCASAAVTMDIDTPEDLSAGRSDGDDR
ncbi:2-phospho-L-lactate guanylyltransferase [Phycisphaerae bacterium RAS1]|nr:2-phospho-L-lactate guanylyltransferase [Phycisphaerae bacterium RAS1]